MKNALSFVLCFIMILFYSILLTACVEDEVRSAGASTASNSFQSSFDGSLPWEKSNPEQYPWEDDANIPNIEVSLSEIPYIPGENDEYGENGDTWELPEWGEASLPFTTDDLYISENPVPEINQMNPDYPLFDWNPSGD